MENKYNILLIDPPWSYDNKKTGGSMKSGALAKYPTLTIEDLCSLKIKKISSKDSVLFLWVTVPLLPEAFQVMKAWGFKYKTMITWNKTGRSGLGYWYRGFTEHLLLGVRGKVKAFRYQRSNIVTHNVLRHSQKPEIFRNIIDKSTENMPERNKIEFFARQRIPGWDSIGIELDGLDVRESIDKLIKGEELCQEEDREKPNAT